MEPETPHEEQQWQYQTTQNTEQDEPTRETSLREPEGQIGQGHVSPMQTQSRQHLGLDHHGPMVEMEIMSQPHGSLRPNEILYPPLTVRLGVQDTENDESNIIGSISHLWTFVSLTDEDGVETVAPPRQGLLTGRLTDSAHPLSSGEQMGPDSDGPAFIRAVTESFVMFPDLAIRELGRYRLRVTLFSMQTSTEEGNVGLHGASSLQEVMTGIIEIRDCPRVVEAPFGKFIVIYEANVVFQTG